MKATVIGCGRWGSFIAWYLRKIGHEVTLYGREGSKHIEQFRQTRSNGLVTLEEDVRVTTDLREALQSELICISIRSQNLPELMAQIAAQGVSGGGCRRQQRRCRVARAGACAGISRRGAQLHGD